MAFFGLVKDKPKTAQEQISQTLDDSLNELKTLSNSFSQLLTIIDQYSRTFDQELMRNPSYRNAAYYIKQAKNQARLSDTKSFLYKMQQNHSNLEKQVMEAKQNLNNLSSPAPNQPNIPQTPPASNYYQGSNDQNRMAA